MPNPRGKFAPPAGKTVLVIGQDTQSINEYVSEVGPFPGGVMIYTNIQDLGGIDQSMDFGAGEHYLGRWTGRSEPFVIQVGLELVGALGSVNSGQLDGNIRALAAALGAAGRPVLLRIGYEFDADWTNYNPSDYQTAFQRVVTEFRNVGADNVAFVWHAWAYTPFNQGSVDPWWPGDDYVDWVGVSVFPGWDDQSGNAAMAKVAAMAAFAQSHDRPLMIAESCPRQVYEPSQGQTSWDSWYAPLFALVEQYDIALLSYINANWEAQPFWTGQGWGDTRVQVNPTVLTNWRNQTSAARYLHSQADLYSQIGWGG